MVWELSGRDISKLEIIENTDYRTCYYWYYMKRVEYLNELMFKVKELEELDRKN